MSDWRTMMGESFSLPQYPHNPQNGAQGFDSKPQWSDSEDIEDIAHGKRNRDAESGKDDETAALCPGDWVEWRSPLFSNFQGEVLEVDRLGENFLVCHPRTGEWVWLPTSWIVRTVKP